MAANAAMLLPGLHYFALNLSIYLYPDNVLMFFTAGSAAAFLQGCRAGAFGLVGVKVCLPC